MLYLSKYLFRILFILHLNIIIQLQCKKKDIIDYTDAEIDKLFDQWEENEEEMDDSDTMSIPSIPDLDALRSKANSADELVMLSKKGKSVMMFVSVKNPNENVTSKQFTEKIASLWQSNFYNNHIEAENFIVDEDRILFLFKEGSQAWDARDFIIRQKECKEILLEGNMLKGPAASEISKNEL